MPFNIGWWGFTFPLGVYSVAVLALARQTGIEAIAIIGSALVLCLAAFWLTIAARTLHGAWRGYLFVSPCLVTGSIPADFRVGRSLKLDGIVPGRHTAGMTLEQLRVFVAVAERQHVTRAASALNLAQSAVSAQIAALEGRHGAKLFDRVGRGIELTEAGRLFLDEARMVLARAEAAELVLSELGGLKRGTLAVAASQTIASYWLARPLVAFRRAYPGVAVRLTVGNTAGTAAAVREGLSEIGFVEGAVEDASLSLAPVARDAMVIVVAPDHAWTERKSLTFEDLVQTEWILREPGSGTRSQFEEALIAKGTDPSGLRVALELPTNEAVRSAVEAGLGATALSASVVAASLEAGLLYEVPLALPDRAFLALFHKERARTRAAEALLAIVANHSAAPRRHSVRRNTAP
jgi:DNA-binding transcriptional LysR family regulator